MRCWCRRTILVVGLGVLTLALALVFYYQCDPRYGALLVLASSCFVLGSLCLLRTIMLLRKS